MRRTHGYGIPSVRRGSRVRYFIGGGISGVTAAYLLARQGYTVALTERSKIAAGYTSQTTAHLTYMTDTRLSDLKETFALKEIGYAWQAGAAAMQEIQSIVVREGIECGLKIVPGYLAAAEGSDVEAELSTLKQEAETAKELGFDAKFIEADLVTGRPAIEFANQMKFHPLQYVDALAKLAEEGGVRVFENTDITAFPEPGCAQAGSQRIRLKKFLSRLICRFREKPEL